VVGEVGGAREGVVGHQVEVVSLVAVEVLVAVEAVGGGDSSLLNSLLFTNAFLEKFHFLVSQFN